MSIRSRIIWGAVGLAIGGLVWAFAIEAAYQHNIRRGLPADFRVHNPRSISIWRT